MAAADHAEAGSAVEIAGLRKLADRLLAGVDQVRIDLVVIGKRADAEHPVLALKRDLHAGRDVVGDQRRDADPEIDVIAVAQLLGGAGGHPVAIPRHQAASLFDRYDQARQVPTA